MTQAVYDMIDMTTSPCRTVTFIDHLPGEITSVSTNTRVARDIIDLTLPSPPTNQVNDNMMCTSPPAWCDDYSCDCGGWHATNPSDHGKTFFFNGRWIYLVYMNRATEDINNLRLSPIIHTEEWRDMARNLRVRTNDTPRPSHVINLNGKRVMGPQPGQWDNNDIEEAYDEMMELSLSSNEIRREASRIAAMSLAELGDIVNPEPIPEIPETWGMIGEWFVNRPLRHTRRNLNF